MVNLPRQGGVYDEIDAQFQESQPLLAEYLYGSLSKMTPFWSVFGHFFGMIVVFFLWRLAPNWGAKGGGGRHCRERRSALAAGLEHKGF